MKCPKCKSEMETVEYQSIEVERCTGCSGLWFELMELETLSALEGSETIDTGDSGTGEKFNALDRIDCPVCDTPMTRMVDKDQPHIWFEKCSDCSGSFFDAGEFSDLKEKTVTDFFKGLFAPPRI